MIDRCRYCGKGGEGSYARQIMVSLWPPGGTVTDETVFYCRACVDEMEREAAFERELMQDPAYAAEARKADEEHKRWFHEALARAVAIH
jgi:hypothetical protein